MKLSETLNAFNNQIIAIKPVIKKAKVLEIRKLIRKIKQLGQKKGSSTQLEKNSKKCSNLKNEIKLIKGLKFNEIAIFSFENENKTFESYMKEKKPKSVEEIALSRVGLSKSVVAAIGKIKEKHASDWKATIIAYRSRFEKKRNWKEKRKLLSELDAKLCGEKKEENQDEEQPDEKDSEAESSPIVDDQQDEEELPKPKKLKKEKNLIKKEKTKKKQIEVKESDESMSDEDETEMDHKEKRKIDENEDEESEEEDPESGEESDEMSSVESESKLDPLAAKKEEESFARLIRNKPAHMEIRRINLDECREMAELPIESKSANVESSSSSYEKSLDKLKNDAFFLDSDGNEVESETKFDPGLDRDRDNDDYSMNNRRWKTDSTTRANHFRSDSSRSFKSSLFDSSMNRSRRPDFKERQQWDRPQRDHRAPTTKPRQPPPEDISKLHPSWQAKKQNEQKLSAVQFKGKKIQFDD